MINKLISLGLLLSFHVIALANDATIWSVNSKAEILRGNAKNVSIDDAGNVTLAPRLAEVYKTEQPYIWSSTSDAAGVVYLGTGGDGKVFKVTPNGQGTLLTDLSELNVTGLALSNGSLFAATSPDGKVYKIDASGIASVYFEPKEKYIWSIIPVNDGSLIVGTGENGRIYKVRSANATPESSLLFDTSETHITTLAVDKQGNIVAGTDSGGLVLRFGADGKPFALLDSPLREIHQLAIGPDGSIYALAIGESASVTASPIPVPSTTPEAKPVTSPASVTNAPPPPQKSRYDLSGAKSAVYRIFPDGGNDVLWASASVTAFSIYAHQTGSGVLIGTGDKGRIYNIGTDARETLVLQTDANQVSTIRTANNALYATSSNQGRLFKFGGESVAEGVYESSVLDAKATAAWGRMWWRSSGNVTFQTRSGNTESANETWSPWTDVGPRTSSSAVKAELGAGGQIASPKARYLQWRAVLKAGTTAPVLNEASLAFLPGNIAPEVLSITILPTNVGLLTNPAPQIDPNIESSGLPPSAFGVAIAPVQPRRVYQRGARAFQWTAEDRNADRLVYDVYYKEAGDSAYKLLKENIAETFATIDGISLADGRYTVKIVAKDAPGNAAGTSLTGDRISEPFDIDNTQPEVSPGAASPLAGDIIRVPFSATDRGSYISRAEYSVNGGEWQTVYADDGISDSPSENYTVQLAVKSPGEYSVTLRVFDANGNAGNTRATVRRPGR